MFEGFSSGVSRTNGVDIAYVIGGSGPPVLLLHGYPQTKALWARIAPILAQNHTVICADLRGYGDSEKPQDTSDHRVYSFREMALDQVGLMVGLGFDRFHLVGHDRGARVAHRLVLDHPAAVLSVSLLDILPTLFLYEETDKSFAQTYWHWFFLIQPSPFPETIIKADPDFFFETCLLGWGASQLSDFDAEQLQAYRTAWNDPEMIQASCNDYRAAASIDLNHDRNSRGQKITCPCFVIYGAGGAMGQLYDVPAIWQPHCEDMQSLAMAGGHFFVDLEPETLAVALMKFFP